jgi:hypothetical protein
MKRFLATAALLATAIAAPASAVTLVAGFNGVGANVASIAKSNISINLTVSALSFANVAPNALTSITGNSATVRTVSQNAFGLGVVGGAVANQMDTNLVGVREAFLVTGSSAFYLTGLVLGTVDADDTLQIYGVNGDGSLVNFTYGSGTNPLNDNAARIAGAIGSGAGGSLANLTYNAAVNGGTATFDTGLTDTRFTRYLITTRVGGNVNYLGAPGQGFTLSGLTATVPEPATWGLMLVGFGLVGVAARRRSTAVAA